MKRSQVLRISIFAAALAVATSALSPALAIKPLLQDSMAATVYIQSSGEADTELQFTFDAGHTKMAINSPEGPVEMIWGADALLVVMHAQRMYLEMDRQMLESMTQMMGRMPGVSGMGGGESEWDPGSFTFEVTGNTEDINGVEASEVLMLEDGNPRGALWMADTIQYGLFEIFTNMLAAMETMNLPMAGQNPAANFQRYFFLARLMGFPAGKVIRVEDPDSGATITLGEVVEGPFPPETWTAPAGYTKQAMPFQD